MAFAISDSGSSLLIDKIGTVEQIYVPKAGCSISNNLTTIFIQSADGKKYTFSYTDITSPVSTDIDNLTDQIEAMLDTGSLAENINALNDQIALDAGNVFRSMISRNTAAAPENVMLFRAGPLKRVKFSLFDLFLNSSVFNTWEAYVNPTYSSPGAVIPSVNAKSDSPTLATAVMRDTPAILTLGTRIRVFSMSLNQQFNVDKPLYSLAPNHSILLRRLNVGAGNAMRLNIHWTEI